MSDPRTRQQWRVGAVVLVALAVLLGALVVTGPLAFHRGQRLAIDYAFIGPIKAGAAVRISGVVVGSVEQVELLAGQDADAGEDIMVRVHVRLQPRAKPVVTDKARYYVTTLGVLGEHYVDIEPQPGGTLLADGARVRGVDLARSDLLLPRAAGFLEILRSLLDEGRPEAIELMKHVAEVIERVDALLETDDSGDNLAVDARQALADARAVLSGLKVAIGDGQQAKQALEDARVVLAEGGQLARGLNDADVPGLMSEGRVTLGKLDATLDKVDDSVLTDARRQRELAHTFERTFWELEEVAKKVTTLVDQLEKGEGAMGKAFQDEQLVDDLKAVLKQLRRNPAGLLFPRTGGPPAPDQ
jgi:phospholipid/cholesterol/gamma-HCH transport system substrate-binding protein